MSFSPEWLALRAPFDTKARDAGLAKAFVTALPPSPLIVDLGAGTGANALALDRLLPEARFRLVDSDRALLEIARTRLQAETVPADLTRDVTWLDGASALSASALMDLVSASWFNALAVQAAERRLPLLFTLNVDGRHALTPTDSADETVFAAFTRDQRRDKGFGPALGPSAPRHMLERLIGLGARVSLAPSDWHVGADGQELLAQFIDGMAEAATHAAPADSKAITGWQTRRQRQIADGALSLTVGHQDLLALW